MLCYDLMTMLSKLIARIHLQSVQRTNDEQVFPAYDKPRNILHSSNDHDAKRGGQNEDDDSVHCYNRKKQLGYN